MDPASTDRASARSLAQAEQQLGQFGPGAGISHAMQPTRKLWITGMAATPP